jgi:hypothetical protein
MEGVLMKTARWICFVLGAACLGAPPAAADGWKLPSLNPFKEERRETSAYTPAAGYAAALEEEPPKSGFKLPSLKLPKFGGGPKPPGQPTAMQRFGAGTKSFFSKTADALTPWDNDKPETPQVRSTGVKRTYNGSPNAAPAQKKGLFSWFTKDDEPERPRTVNDFIAQPRPRF